MSCILCETEAEWFANVRERNYFLCPKCKAVFMDAAAYVSEEEERERYLEHNNDVDDPNYQTFVSPLVQAIEERHRAGSEGLDFGSGTGPVAAKLLENDGYSVITYDPFFDQNETALQQKYDFIICSEVVEHFHQPAKEFGLLYSMLKSGGTLCCMTLRYAPEIDFETWYYKNDETHVIFYQDETARWIKKHYGFSRLTLKERLIILEK